ncbi:enoyl-CoA hydratase/isomerase family protein [Thermoplasma volcanium]|nr:enoyl-CoA hydratase/isomerase family protein [Thermoplasma volcanium]
MPRCVLEEVDDIAILKFTRSEKLNAFDFDSWREFSSNVDEASNYKGLIITGEGRAFSSGDDINAMYKFEDYAESKSFFKTLFDVLQKLMHYPHPIIAAVNGLAAGGGAEILLTLDYVVSVKDAWFWFPEARIGLYPPILTSLGVYVFGIKNVKKLAINMPRLTSEEALNLGLVDMIIEDKNKLTEIAVNKVRELNRVPTVSYTSMRKVLASIVLPHLKQSLDTLAETAVEEEAKRSMELFIKSRKK